MRELTARAREGRRRGGSTAVLYAAIFVRPVFPSTASNPLVSGFDADHVAFLSARASLPGLARSFGCSAAQRRASGPFLPPLPLAVPRASPRVLVLHGSYIPSALAPALLASSPAAPKNKTVDESAPVSSPRYRRIALRSLLVTTKKGESRDYRAAQHGEYEHGNPSVPARLSPPTATMTSGLGSQAGSGRRQARKAGWDKARASGAGWRTLARRGGGRSDAAGVLERKRITERTSPRAQYLDAPVSVQRVASAHPHMLGKPASAMEKEWRTTATMSRGRAKAGCLTRGSCSGRGGSVACGGRGCCSREAPHSSLSVVLLAVWDVRKGWERSRDCASRSHARLGGNGWCLSLARKALSCELSCRPASREQKAAKAAQARPRDPRAAHLRCFGGSLAPRLSLDHDLQRPTSSAVEGARRVLGWDEW
ncbi:hypothetical protein B0H13DRAFT_2279910 [Mycena leptocephala]|nr:hypothetical protein B0H13DRAFT_2279910 [Mycena leptocephala]